MYLFIAFVLAVIGVISSPGSISDVPFAQLTLRMLVSSVFAWACFLGALFYVFKSLGEDRVWPWRWTWPYFGNLLVRAAFGALFVFGASALFEKMQLDGWTLSAALAVLGILLLFTLFSSEFEYFKESKKPRDPVLLREMNKIGLRALPGAALGKF